MSNTLYLSTVVNNFDENSDPFHARYLATLNQQLSWPVSGMAVKTFVLDATQTATFGAATNAGYRFMALKVVGKILLDSDVNDSGGSPVLGVTGCYGTSIFPGWILLSTQKIVTVFTITSQADGTTIDLLYGAISS